MKRKTGSILNRRIVGVSLAIVAAAVMYSHGPTHDPAEAATPPGWLTEPTVFNDAPVNGECPPVIEIGPGAPFCVSVKTMRSGFTGGRYGFDPNRDGVNDAILTMDAELLSEIKRMSNGTYEYTWTIRNLGSGALIGVHAGPNGPGFAISIIEPLLGSAGADRLPDTGDDIAEPPVYAVKETSTTSDHVVNGRLAANPTTGRLAGILVPLADSPTLKAQCKDDGWQDFGFGNQGQCVSYVETGNDSRVE